MIILDTNIISELMKPLPNEQVMAWISEQQTESLFVTSITIAEISYGISILPKGSKRSFLETAFHQAINEAFSNRILFFDDISAHVYGAVMAQRKIQGKPMSIPDGQIAAIAKTHKAVLATRNLSDFIDSGIQLTDPFQDH